jgi:hypothetical protein
MNLNKKLRTDIADQLMIKAVAHNAETLVKRMEAINKEFWAAHIENVKKVFPVPQKQWAELIQLGLVNGVYTVTPRKAQEEDSLYPVEITGISRKGYNVTLSEGRTEFEHTLGKVLFSEPFSEFKTHVQNNFDTYRLRLTAPSTLPALEGVEKLPHCHPLVAELKSVEDDFLNVVKEAMAFRAELASLLEACKTKKQLQELVPEAAALIPEPEKPKRQVVPVEQAEKVRKMLEKGVPPKAT